AYVASNNVFAYSINAATGALTPVAGSPFTAGTTPVSVTVAPSGAFAYVANANSNNVSAYTINAATGALTPVAGSPFAAGSAPYSVVATNTSAAAPPVPTLSINDVPLPEGNAGITQFTFTVTLSAPSASTVTVHYATADGTATAGSDY